eukprot:CAMPEP_0203745910 /NCGR_PEP_ID=MMETSP0098-20131031/1506_1 /ASSEMBLY_ACC=CAM_ASM_000208 /TAXON_ID=96639 /ORGANISM=" , Strain NY0313808BC1" /LENGTH=1043 /DNA_ID=CAMNT_0050633823 /DNA_START=262 /DNA_END=3390 /DNA_ORIENTATION=-
MSGQSILSAELENEKRVQLKLEAAASRHYSRRFANIPAGIAKSVSRKSCNLRHKPQVGPPQQKQKAAEKKDVQYLCNEAVESVKQVVLEQAAGSNKLTRNTKRSVLQRDGPRRGNEASFLCEFAQQINICKPARKSKTPLDEKIGQRQVLKTFKERAEEEWKLADMDGNGVLELDELRFLFSRLNVRVPDSVIRDYMHKYDVDKSGTLDFDEFFKMFEAIQSKPDLKQEFLIAKVLGSGEDSIKQVVQNKQTIDEIALTPYDLQRFMAWSTNDSETPTLEECAYRIHTMTSRADGNAQHDISQWSIPKCVYNTAEPELVTNDVALELDEEEAPRVIRFETLDSINESVASSPRGSQTGSQSRSPRGLGSARERFGSHGSVASNATIMSAGSEYSQNSLPPSRLVSSATAPPESGNHFDTIQVERFNSTRPQREPVSPRAQSLKPGAVPRKATETKVRRRDRLSRLIGRKTKAPTSKPSNNLPSWHPDSSEYNMCTMDYDTFTAMFTHCTYNMACEPSKLYNVYQDMTQPLSAYYISSSHNSYLSGNQLSSQSTAYAISRALRLGVRVIELDAWNGDNHEPIVTHGNTLCKPMPFKECIYALKENGFVASSYPVIITIENHCSMAQQEKQVEYMNEILGDALHRFPVANDGNLKEGVTKWSSPEELRYKFVIRDRPNKKMSKHDIIHIKSVQKNQRKGATGMELYVDVKNPSSQYGKTSALGEDFASNLDFSKTTPGAVQSLGSFGDEMFTEGQMDDNEDMIDENEDEETVHEEDDLESAPELLKEDIKEYDTSSDGVTPALLKLMYIKNISIPVKSIGDGSVVVYHAPHYRSSSSLSETKMRKLATPGARAAALNSYSKSHLIRVYPAGSRITSSNYDPVPAWNAGCQVVALNYQSFGAEVWLNQGKFCDNGGCGYVLKPATMMNAVTTGVVQQQGGKKNDLEEEDNQISKTDRKAMSLFGHKSIHFDKDVMSLPWTLVPGDASYSTTPTILRIELLSAHYLPTPSSSNEVNPFMEITLRGLEDDDRTYRSKWIENNGFDPTW